MISTLELMFASLERNGGAFRPSKLWRELNRLNIQQLETLGLDNIKQTVATNYFTFLIRVWDDQFRALVRHIGPSQWRRILRDLPPYQNAHGLSRLQFFQLCVFTRMLWEYAQQFDSKGLLERVQEPLIGNPFPITYQGRLISQDTINSVTELYSIFDGRDLDFAAPIRVTELGAGYGRNAYVFQTLFKACKYVIIDIPPALYVSQEYLSATLPGRKIFEFRDFESFASVRNEFEAADLCFLLPHQAALLPEKSTDIFLNISSLHEMTVGQIEAYFSLVDRLTRRSFYLKQWKLAKNRVDQVRLSESSYPYRPHWRKRYSRTALLQPNFFEAIYDLP